ncbi:AB hydrolase superfamily protein [Cercospora beticola]|uniref:AB hydrolase superfamily protein n=1 Tax=Cercospora beticola TaxID=122368 RepID=A0A2G5HPT7_CERBT|nr:AB hydrolase superfamily protein [Cercospora beticola]PIA94538.1 AB hydrolase superfamily protein [Cercospora beticola]WPB05156.1 hypothetical protein RHO25_009806 [Cercospora beticola]CAK1364942.1 unnamed protein product [Cercospora beticola]
MLFTKDFTSMSREEILQLAEPTEEYQEMMDVWPPVRIDWQDTKSTLAKVRMQTELADELDEPDRDVEETFRQFPARDGYQLTLRIFTSRRHTVPNGSIVVLWHGGGWVIGSPTMTAGIARSLCKRFGCLVLAPNYRLAPEHVWPTSLNDAWDSFNYIRNEYDEEAERHFIIGGISAGAHMALVIAHMAKEENLEPKITGVYSACGSIQPLNEGDLDPVYRERYLSRTQPECADNPVLSKEMKKFMTDCAKADPTSKSCMPLLWPGNEKHEGLPKVYQQVCGRDYSRDEALIFDDILKKNGGKSRVNLYPGLPHCFWLALGGIPEYRQWEQDTISGFQWLLSNN